jgi:hypothetical protein
VVYIAKVNATFSLASAMKAEFSRNKSTSNGTWEERGQITDRIGWRKL